MDKDEYGNPISYKNKQKEIRKLSEEIILGLINLDEQGFSLKFRACEDFIFNKLNKSIKELK